MVHGNNFANLYYDKSYNTNSRKCDITNLSKHLNDCYMNSIRNVDKKDRGY